MASFSLVVKRVPIAHFHVEFIGLNQCDNAMWKTLGVVTPSRRSENGFSENGEWGKRGANRIASPWRKVWHPFVAFSENGEWKKRPRERNMRPAVKPSPRILHSSPAEEKKLGFPFSKNGPSTIHGEGAKSPFSDLWEWEERGVTTLTIYACSTQQLHQIHRCQFALQVWGPDNISHSWHHLSSYLAVIVWKVVGQHTVYPL